MSMKLNLKLLATRFSQTKDGPPVSEDGVNRYLLEQVLRPNLEGDLLRLGEIDFDAFDADDVRWRITMTSCIKRRRISPSLCRR